MGIELTTGVPGAGKTLYTVAEVLLPLSRAVVKVAGQEVPRRLCIAGIPELLVAHELLDAPEIHMDTFSDPWGDVVREPGQAPIEWAVLVATKDGGRWRAAIEGDQGAVPVPMKAENWWCWVRPGDVVVIDECQTVFRPMSAGKRVPTFILRLERHRHYGIDFVLITQHPQRLHANVRTLVGKHRHVRRLFGRRGAMIYEWDHCSAPDRVRTASTSVWRYKRSAFQLYKSAELHTKQKFATQWVLIVGLLAILATPALWWVAFKRQSSGVAQATAVAAPASAPTLGTPAPARGQQEPGKPLARFPEYQGTADRQAEPYGGRAFVLEGEWQAGGLAFAVFGLMVDGERVATVTLRDLVSAGYTWERRGPCAGFLRLGDAPGRRVTCGPPRPIAPERAASASV